MASINSISSQKLYRLIGTPKRPVIIDVRTDDEFARDPRLLPGARHVAVGDLESEVGRISSARGVVVVCSDGGAQSEGGAALLRQAGVAAETLEDGFGAWVEAGLPAVPVAKLPHRDQAARTIWVTRSRPKIDRIACPWLIRRFIDDSAVFLFVPASEVPAVAERFNATPFDMEEGGWTHRGQLCTFDVMIEEFQLMTEPLLRLATMVRAADTDRLHLAPEAPGLLAVSLGLSRLFTDDIAQLEAGMTVYDALYLWARDATDETHGWPPRWVKSKPEKKT
jgi:rhodanese-related sulfurtransferase